MKTKSILTGIIALSMSAISYGQEIGMYAGGTVVRGELTEYAYNPQFTMSLNSYWEVSGSPHFRYGVEARFASMGYSPSIENGWLNGYQASGSDFSLMGSARYYINKPINMKARGGSFLFFAQGAVGFHVARYQTTIPSVNSIKTSNKTELSEDLSTNCGALELGAGMQYYFNTRWSLTLVAGGQYTGNDYLDGVAGIGEASDYPVFVMLGGSYGIF